MIVKTKKKKTLPELLDKLDFSVDTVAAAAMEQPRLFENAADYRVGRMERRILEESKLDVTRSSAAIKLRDEARKSGDKLTEAMVTELLNVDANVQESNNALGEAEAKEEYAKLLLEAYRMRRDSLRIVSDLLNAQMSASQAFESVSRNMDKMRSKLRDKYPGGE